MWEREISRFHIESIELIGIANNHIYYLLNNDKNNILILDAYTGEIKNTDFINNFNYFPISKRDYFNIKDNIYFKGIDGEKYTIDNSSFELLNQHFEEPIIEYIDDLSSGINYRFNEFLLVDESIIEDDIISLTRLYKGNTRKLYKIIDRVD